MEAVQPPTIIPMWLSGKSRHLTFTLVQQAVSNPLNHPRLIFFFHVSLNWRDARQASTR